MNFRKKTQSVFPKQEVRLLESTPREIADASENFQFTVWKNKMKHFVLEQIKTHTRTHTKEAWKHAGKWLHGHSIGETKKIDSK